ncbi:MAG: hypothetical protein IK104_02325 [Clostridia bacterium]|nr:hypothetical protein [Clostridia bacterium]
MKLKRILAAAAAGALLFTLPGCLAFKNTLDLTPDASGTGAYVPVTDASVVAPTYDQSTTLPGYTVPTAPSETATQPGQNVSEPSSGGTQQPSSQTQPGIQVPAGNEYDILRSGNFSLSALMISGNDQQEMNVAVSPAGDLYVNADVDGLEMGILIKNKKTYLMYPPEKKYLELNEFVLNLMQLDPSEFTSIADDLGFTTMNPLDKASAVIEGSYNGTPCQVYIMVYDDESTSKIYMSGTKLLAVENYDANGNKASVMEFHSITSGFPQMPPSDYKKSGYMEFLTLLASAMEE